MYDIGSTYVSVCLCVLPFHFYCFIEARAFKKERRKERKMCTLFVWSFSAFSFDISSFPFRCVFAFNSQFVCRAAGVCCFAFL